MLFGHVCNLFLLLENLSILQCLLRRPMGGQHEMWKLAFRPPPLVALRRCTGLPHSKFRFCTWLHGLQLESCGSNPIPLWRNEPLCLQYMITSQNAKARSHLRGEIAQIVNKQTGSQISRGAPRVVESGPCLSENNKVNFMKENSCILQKSSQNLS